MFERIMLITICVLIALTVVCNITGCSVLQKITETFKTKPEQTEPVIPKTPKEQLWKTIKGLTPNWLAIPVIALGAVAMFNGAFKLGMSFIIFGSVNLFMALATSRFGYWMAVCGLIGSMAAVISSILVKNKALKEIVFGVQRIKTEVAVSERDVPEVKEILAKQTKSTKKLVQKIKSKAKLQGEL